MFPSRRAALGGDVFRDEYSIAFDGTDDYIDFGDVHDLGTGNFSITAWVNIGTWVDFMILSKRVGNTNKWNFGGNGSAKLAFYSIVSSGVVGVTVAGAATLEANKWVHVAVSMTRASSGTGIKRLFINSNLDDAEDGVIDDDVRNIDNDADLIVAAKTASSGWKDGNISEIAIYDTALSDSQIKTIYNSREPYNHRESSFSSNLTGWWRMGDGTERGAGNTIYDMSINSNNGTWSGASSGVTSIQYEGDTP